MLPDALEAAFTGARIRRATIVGAGALRSAEVALGDEGAPRRFEGELELVHLTARWDASDGVGVVARVQLARETEAGLQVIGGRLLEAVVQDVELDLEALEDLEEVRGLAALARGTEVRRERSSRSADSPPEPAPASPWAAVAEASAAHDEAPAAPRPAARQRPRRGPGAGKPLPPLLRPDPIPEKRREPAEALATDEVPERGDHVEHRQFGLCRVDGEDAHGGLIIRLPGGRRKTINLDYLEVLPPRIGADGRVFPLRPRRKS